MNSSLPRTSVSFLLFLIVLVVYATTALRTVAATPLTYDEVYTVCLSQFSSPGQLWTWLESGTDLNPPLNYLITHLALQTFGTSPVGARIPSVAAYGGAVLFTFLFLRLRHRSELAGWLGGLALLACNLPFYAVVARAYALMVFWGAAALLLWYLASHAKTAARRMWAAAGLGTALAAGIFSHYYCVLIVVPLGIAEATRLMTTGRIHKATVLALAVGAAQSLWLLPLVRTARGFSSGFWRHPSWADIEICYGNILLNFALPVFLTAGVAFGVRRTGPAPESEPEDRVADAAVLGYLLIPAAGVILAMVGTGAFDKRYVILGYLGAAGVLAGLASLGLRRNSLGAGLVLLVLGGWALLGTELRYRKKASEAGRFQETVTGIRGYAASGTVYVVDPELFLPVAFETPDVSGRLVYPADPALAKEFTGSDTDDRNLLQLAKAAPRLAVKPFTECVPLMDGIVVGDGWQKVVWEKQGVKFKTLDPIGPKGPVYRIIALPR